MYSIHQFYGRVFVCASLLLLTGCYQIERWDEASEHVVAIDQRGRPMNPDTWRAVDSKAFEHQLEEVLEGMRDYHDSRPNEPRRILVFVHGGLNAPETALNRSKEMAQCIKNDGYYPIFIVWETDLISSYWWEHLFRIRRGRFNERGWILMPAYLLADLGRAALRAPIVWAQQFGNDFNRGGAEIAAASHRDPKQIIEWNPQLAGANAVTRKLLQCYHERPDQAIALSIGPSDYIGWDRPWSSQIVETGTIWVRYLTSPVVDALGKPAWDNMYRRALVLFDGTTSENLEDRTRSPDASVVINPKPGSMERLMGKLADYSGEDGATCEVTLIGHSMGSIVLNELVRRNTEMSYKHIVFMAAACSVRDFHRAIVPYLESHPETSFYNLTLHPGNEVREMNYLVMPRGSLLIWIDDMFETPRTTLDRTLGRWDNIGHAVYGIPPDVWDQVHWKTFAIHPHTKATGRNPQKHGHFSNAAMAWWRCDFWQPSPPDVAIRDYEGQAAKRVR